jgi:O-antigen ligase
MNLSSQWSSRAALILALASAAAVVVSIAVSHILLALAFAALLLSDEKLRLPPIKLPLALFLIGTIISVALSENPSAGRTQLRKLYVFLMLLVLYSTMKHIGHVRRLVLAWAGLAVLSSALSFAQFWRKLESARDGGESFYAYYISERITGFMSHWMTIAGQQMIVLMMLAALLFFSPARKRWLVWLIAALATITASLLIGMTRSVWLATALGGVYLLWQWKPWTVLAVPFLLGVAVAMGPDFVRTRVSSAIRPQQEVDSNEHRVICRRTGWEMIKAHPWFGIGPEIVNIRFEDYVPPDIPKPLPTGWYGHLHNIYLQYAAERGIPTMLVLMWLIGKIVWDFACALRRAPAGVSDHKFVLHGAIAAIAGVLVAGFWEYNLGDSEVLQMFLAVVACGYVAVDTLREPGVV